MKVIISAGGTGGHIYPALAIINKIKEKEPNSQFLYIGTHNRMEKELIPNHNIPYEEIEIYGFNKKIWKNVKTIKCLINASKKCKNIIKQFKPDVVIGVGGYVTVPVIKEASKLGYKTFIHEQNSIPGKANQYLSKYATKIGISFKSSENYFKKEKIIFTGNPCSEEAIKIKPALKSEFGLNENKKLVLFVMGSLGAKGVNNFLIKTMSLFNNKNYEVLFVTGKSDYDNIKTLKFPSNVKVVPYIDKIPRIMKKTDLIVSRAGASILSEIVSLNIPSILIPSPYVPNNHQYKNAMDLVSKNAASIILEKDLKGDIIVRKIDELLNDENKIKEMKTNLLKESISDSQERIYNCLKEIDRK